jgi:hypothetical protein
MKRLAMVLLPLMANAGTESVLVRGKNGRLRATLLRVPIEYCTNTREVPQIKQIISNSSQFTRKILLDLGRVARFV